LISNDQEFGHFGFHTDVVYALSKSKQRKGFEQQSPIGLLISEPWRTDSGTTAGGRLYYYSLA